MRLFENDGSGRFRDAGRGLDGRGQGRGLVTFDYDLDLQTHSIEERDSYERHDISFRSPAGGRVPAYLFLPLGEG